MKTKKIQKKSDIVEIFGEKFNIVFVDPADIDGDYGQFEDDTNTISINKSISKDLTLKTLAHEMTHAALSVGGVSGLLGLPQEEAICRINEHLLFVFLKYFKDLIN